MLKGDGTIRFFTKKCFVCVKVVKLCVRILMGGGFGKKV